MSARDAQVILCGPFPEPGSLGGYARCNELIATSFLAERFGIRRLPITTRADGGRLGRLARDLSAGRSALADCAAPVFHLTAQYQAGTWREAGFFELARRHGRAFLLDIRAGCFVECFEHPGAFAQRALWRRVLRGAAAITVEGREDADWIARNFGREAVWFPNFVAAADAERFDAAELVAPAPGEPLRLVYAGRLVAEKGVEELVEAAALLRDRGLPCAVSFIGRGPEADEARLRQRIEEHRLGGSVTLLGSLSREDLLRELARHHVFVFPSRWFGEGHSNAVNEAMQVGLPVITTRQGFLASVVTPECGVVVADPQPARLADAVAELASSWEELRARGAAGRRRVHGEFSDTVALGRLAEVYATLLRDSRTGP